MIIVFLFLTFLCSFTLIILFRRYAISRQLLDIPNERSSHTVAVPRGGGLAIVIAFLLSLVGLQFFDALNLNILYAMTGTALIVAGVGLWDDHNDISMKFRLCAHFLSAFWLLYWFNEAQLNPVLDFNQLSSWLIFLFASTSLVWLLNLYNFMDGIDGIASSEAIFISAAIGFFAYMEGHHNISLMAFSLMTATLGFLIFNWPPAKIFMGDAGSGFLGIVLGGLAILLALKTSAVFPWLILFAVFIVDATTTLLLRMLRGERWYEAHCQHGYQHAAKKWGHLKVTMSVNAVNAAWLLPLAYIAYRQTEIAFTVMIIAYIPLVVAALFLGAGRENAN